MYADAGTSAHVVYEFGTFCLDSNRRLLFASNIPDALPAKSKVVEALLYFVQRPGELLTKDQLLAELWPGVVVEENSLTKVISALRQLLGESPGQNHYVATVPGRGYRFVAAVTRRVIVAAPRGATHEAAVAIAEASSFAPPSPASRTRPVQWARLGLAGLSIILCGALLVLMWHVQRSSEPPAPIPSHSTVAVLPFENLSAGEGDEFIALGLAESVLHRLAAVDGLTLIARTSSFAFRNQAVDAREIGRSLNARYLVEGSLQRADDRLRVTAQLIDADTGLHLWSLRLDRTVDDIFAVEDEIANRVADALRVSLDQPQHPYAQFGTDTYLAFLQGRSLAASRRISDVERAIERLSRVIEMAPDFAAAYVTLANAHWQLGYLKAHGPERSPLYWRTGGASEALVAGAQNAEPYLVRALALDDSLGEAYVLRADLKAIDGDFEGAEADYLKGLALSPEDGAGYRHYAEFLERVMRQDDAANTQWDKAILVDPVSPESYYFKGHPYLVSEETGVLGERAEAYYLDALKSDPDFYPALLRLGGIRWHQGRFSEAVTLAEQAQAIDPRAAWIRWFLVEFYLELEDADAARSALEEAPDPLPPEQWLALCLYEGNLARAAGLLRAEPTRRRFIDHDIEAFVFRDAAIASGDLERGRHDLVTYPVMAGMRPEDDPNRMVALAQLELVAGNRHEAERLAQAMLDFKDERAGVPIAYRLAYERAAALTLLDRREAALDLLEDAFARGYRKRWWYAFERNPAFEPLHSDARFQSLTARARAHAAAEREKLERLRERGDVPYRRPQGLPGAGPC